MYRFTSNTDIKKENPYLNWKGKKGPRPKILKQNLIKK